MAKSAKAVEEFLADLATKLKPLVDKELKELSRYKSEEVCGSTSCGKYVRGAYLLLYSAKNAAGLMMAELMHGISPITATW